MPEQGWTSLPLSPTLSPSSRDKETVRGGVIWSILDFLWSSFVVVPLVVMYWRGTWDLLEDFVVLPPNFQLHPELQRQMSGLVCYLGGLLTRITLDMVKFHVGLGLKKKSFLCQILCLWVFNALYSLAGVSFWRGVWFLLRIDVGVEPYKLLAVLLCGLLVLILNKISRSLISSPLAIGNDDYRQLSVSQSLLQHTPQSVSGCWFIVDVLFTNIVIRQLVVFCWWSLWSLENQFFFYQNMDSQSHVISYDSLLVGYSGAMITLCLDTIRQHCTPASSVVRRVFSTMLPLLAFFSCVNVWRGIWSLLNVFFLPSLEPDANYMVGHLVGILSLTGLFLSSTIASDSIVVDSEEDVVNTCYWRTQE